jgi:hypothetical protein
MVEWVEDRKPPDYLVATKPKFSKDRLSVTFAYTRKLCPVSRFCSDHSTLTFVHCSIRRGPSITVHTQTSTRRSDASDRSETRRLGCMRTY